MLANLLSRFISYPIIICRGYVFSIICLIPGFVFCIMNKNKLPEICASHFNIHDVPDGFMSRVCYMLFILWIGRFLLDDFIISYWNDFIFWLIRPYIPCFVILILVIFLCLPINAYNGLNKDYYKKNNRFNMLKSMYCFHSFYSYRSMNMMAILGSLTAIFFFSILEPNYEYNMKVYFSDFYLIQSVKLILNILFLVTIS